MAGQKNLLPGRIWQLRKNDLAIPVASSQDLFELDLGIIKGWNKREECSNKLAGTCLPLFLSTVSYPETAFEVAGPLACWLAYYFCYVLNNVRTYLVTEAGSLPLLLWISVKCNFPARLY